MPSITLGVSQAGPTVNILLGPSTLLADAMRAAGLVPPANVMALFLVDTVASHTVVDANVIRPLGLNPTGTVMCHTPSTAGTAVPMYQYDLMIYVPSQGERTLGWYIDSIPVTASSFDGQSISGLIGRDILDRGLLIYNGAAGQFTLSY